MTAQLLLVALLWAGAADATAPQGATVPKCAVAVLLRTPEFTVRELKYRVFYNKGEIKRIPLTDYDFKAAFTDEIVASLEADKRMSWRAATANEKIDVMALWDRKAAMPSIGDDRILLVDVVEYGAFLASLGPDKFYLSARLKLIDRKSGAKLWEKKITERSDLPGKMTELQADNQKGLKEGVNKILEQICRKFGDELRRAKV